MPKWYRNVWLGPIAGFCVTKFQEMGTYCDAVSDNFRIINPADFRVLKAQKYISIYNRGTCSHSRTPSAPNCHLWLRSVTYFSGLDKRRKSGPRPAMMNAMSTLWPYDGGCSHTCRPPAPPNEGAFQAKFSPRLFDRLLEGLPQIAA